MKKHISIFVILLTLSFNSFSQFKIGISAGIGFATDSVYAAKVSKIGGAALMVKYVFADRLSVGLNLGFNGLDLRPLSGSTNVTTDGTQTYIDNTNTNTQTKTFTLVPITASVEYFFSKKALKPYVGVDLGLYKFNYNNALIAMKEIHVSYFGLGVAPTIGFLIETMPNLELGFNLKYNIVFENSLDNRTNMFGNHNTSSKDSSNPHVVVLGDQYISHSSPMQYLALNLTIMYKFGKSSLATEVTTPPESQP